MILEQVRVGHEIHEGIGSQGSFLLGDTLDMLDFLSERCEGEVKLIYLDPPFLTGERFYMRVRVGENEWKTGKGSLLLESFVDQKDREAFLSMMRRVLTAAHRMLRSDGPHERPAQAADRCKKVPVE